MTRSRRIPTALSLAVAVIVALGAGASPALAGETHPVLIQLRTRSPTRTGSRSTNRPATSTSPTSAPTRSTSSTRMATQLDFAALGSNALTGAATPAKSFSFPSVYGSPAAIAVDNACVQHAPALTGKACEEFDPSAGDLYVMDAGHGVIDKFSPEGRYLSQIGLPQLREANCWGWASTEAAPCTST